MPATRAVAASLLDSAETRWLGFMNLENFLERPGHGVSGSGPLGVSGDISGHLPASAEVLFLPRAGAVAPIPRFMSNVFVKTA